MPAPYPTTPAASSALDAVDPTPLSARQRAPWSGYWAKKVVLITGGSSGLGRSIAEAFARQGADIVISARSADTLESAATQLRAYGTQVLAIAADVTRQDDVQSLVDQAVRQFGRLDVLVNNVGRSQRAPVLDVTPEDFESLMALNFLGVVRCTRAAAPHLIHSRGHLVNIGSLSGKSASPYVGAYAVTKFALSAYTQQLRLELGPQGVHVLLVSSGPIARDDAGRRYGDQLEGLPPSAGKPGAGVRIRAVRPDRLAQAVLKACRRRQPELVYPGIARLFFAIMQLFPRTADWIVRKWT